MTIPRILAVDDEPAVGEMLRFILEQEGFQADFAEDATQAINFIRKARPDLILLDWMMPGMTGIELAGRLKAEKLIFLTDVDGIIIDRKLVPTVTTGGVERHIQRGAIAGGMIPKTQSMVKALGRGVKKTHIINGNVPHSLLLEIYTDQGIGTELVKR